jgi:hypothetical protein
MLKIAYTLKTLGIFPWGDFQLQAALRPAGNTL